MKKLSHLLIAFIFTISCVSHRTTFLQSIVEDKNAAKYLQDDVIISAKVLGCSSKDVQVYKDLIDSGFLPIQLRLENCSSVCLRFNREDLMLEDQDERFHMATSEEIVDDLSYSYSPTFIWTFFAGVFGLFGSLSNVGENNIKLIDDIESKIIKSGMLQPGEYLEGLIFFKNPVNKKRDNLYLYVPIISLDKINKSICIKIS